MKCATKNSAFFRVLSIMDRIEYLRDSLSDLIRRLENKSSDTERDDVFSDMERNDALYESLTSLEEAFWDLEDNCEYSFDLSD